MAKLRDAGVPLTDETPRDGFTGRLSYLAPEAFDGAQIEIVQPEDVMSGRTPATGSVTRIDHVVFRVPDVRGFTERFGGWFGIETKRTFERGEHTFAFMRPGDVVMEVIGPTEFPAEPRPGYIAGLALETNAIDYLAANVKALGYPIGEPHPALQGGRIASVHHTGACGVPLAFNDFTGSPGPAHREAGEE